MVNRKVTLTVTIAKKNYDKLKMIVPSGRVSEVINELIEDWTNKKEKEISSDYQKDIKDKDHDEQIKSWYLIHRKKIKLNEERK